MRKIFICIDWYLPAYKAGGPIIATVNFVHWMKRHYELFVFTSDRDLGDSGPMPNIEIDRWVSIEPNVNIFYASRKSLSGAGVLKEIRKINPDFIYLNSVYSLYFAIWPLLLRKFARLKARFILAPRGMLKESAIEHKRLKKIGFLRFVRWTGLHRKLVFQATDEQEVHDVQYYFGKHADISLVPDLVGQVGSFPEPLEKRPTMLSLIFVGRIHPIKNLHFLLDCIRGVDCQLSLTIAGSIEDKEYWKECLGKVDALQGRVRIRMFHELRHNELMQEITKQHALVLPTRGENFGHAIFESLSLGKPVIISDQTPWRHLEDKRAGWDIPLEEPERFVCLINELGKWEQPAYDEWSRGAWTLANNFVSENNLLSKYQKLFS